MEPRQLLSATVLPIHLGAVYFEDSHPHDEVGDVFEITFQGGAPGTQLAELRIDTDKLGDGLGMGDTFFDTAPGGLGVYGSSPFAILSQDGIDSVTATVADGGTQLVLQFQGFDVGEKLVFSIDVDEQGFLGPNAVAEGGEFEGSILTAAFTAPHYMQADGSDVFYDAYDDKLAAAGLDLPNDQYNPPSPYMPPGSEPGPVYTAAAIFPLQQSPLPITLSGTVFEDFDVDNKQQPGEPGIGDVALTLYELVDDNYVSTGQTTTTDADGNYLFEGLLPGTYQVVETQPDGYFSVGATAGTVGGQTRGVVITADMLGGINLDGGDHSVHNDFAETLPAELSGFVYIDADNNGVFDWTETGIGGVELVLLDADGEPTGLTAITNEWGFYYFEGLAPGVYGVAEAQPAGYYDGLDTAGTAGGAAHNPGDLIDAIPLAGGMSAKEYNFGELPPAGIGGQVYADFNDNDVLDPDDVLLGGVTVYLLDGTGNRIASTTTDGNGRYIFTDLAAGVYGVEEIQPAAYLEGGDRVGSVGGALDGPNRILSAQLDPGVEGVNYDFWEVPPAMISGYVFQDGLPIVIQEGDPPPYIPSLRDGKLTPDDKRLPGVMLQLCDGSSYPLLDAQGNPITTVTDADGYYQFDMLYPGVYSIVEVQPEEYLPGISTAGSNGGLVVNSYSSPDPGIVGTLAVDPNDSAIVRIPLDPGDVAVEYNFSHVLVEMQPPPPPPPPLPPYYPPSTPTPLPPPPTALPFVEYRPVGHAYYLAPEIVIQPIFGGAGGPGGYTWHLSIIDAGQPRRAASGNEFTQVPQNMYFDPVSWTGADMGQSRWILADKDGVPIKKLRFGRAGAMPVAGDWNGDGMTKIGVFLDGLWFLDLNGNGVWDEGDLWVKLGKAGDQPVSGDWNGDGKTDVGIFGPKWIGDDHAVAVEPGLPDSQNPPKSRPKNVPPNAAEAAVGWRTMKKGYHGKMRSDLIDHVFQYGTKGDLSVTGDWNGDGIHTIGIFRNGAWFLDMDGDGRWSADDVAVDYGQQGDVPLVGDWTGDCLSKLGVYRNGTFHLDTNNNHQIDAADKVFELGGAGDRPAAGDWNGDGIDEVGVYQDGAAADAPLQASRQ